MRLLLPLLLLLAAALLDPAPVAWAQAAPFCQAGQAPAFLHGFGTLKARLGAAMGEPIECEHANAVNGDTLQQTTTGLAFYRESTNTPTFTDGHRHWALTAADLVYWEGLAIDPPITASPVRVAGPPGPPGVEVLGFVRGVVPEINAFWRDIFAGAGVSYVSAGVSWVEFGQTARTACGRGLLSGPLYCRIDRTIYLDSRFFQELWAFKEDAAVVVVIAHEWGHHIQDLLGIDGRRRPGLTIELQADCMAGMFFRHAASQGRLQEGDLDEAAAVSLRSGDPTWRSPTDRRAHGSGEQRVSAFRQGYNGESCFS
ncbi:MAG: neutral zinc metallopeptidase [Chloroflexi bacterium]|nr:neutral zinc metallopeptidase [Chloroflexota bacterium]